jgi:hypothetical protein
LLLAVAWPVSKGQLPIAAFLPAMTLCSSPTTPQLSQVSLFHMIHLLSLCRVVFRLSISRPHHCASPSGVARICLFSSLSCCSSRQTPFLACYLLPFSSQRCETVRPLQKSRADVPTARTSLIWDSNGESRPRDSVSISRYCRRQSNSLTRVDRAT